MFRSKCSATMSLLAVIAGSWGCSSRSSSDGSSGGTGGGGNDAAGGASGTGGGAGADSAVSCTHASSWELVDDYLRSPGEPSNIAGITVDSKGSVYAVGLARAGTFAGIVRKSTNGGGSWVNAA